MAALNLTGVGDVVWDLEVVNGRLPTADVVWQRRLSSSRYGDGAGSASYVGPCDADAGVAENTVKVWVVGVYSDAVTALGTFASGAGGGVVGDALPFQNPTTLAAPLSRKVVCRPDGDVAVQFDVALMRPAQQGFFDIAVSFNNIFCSAKFDCCADTDGNGCNALGLEDLELLFEAGGARGATMVLGFACTAGPGADTEAQTQLYLDTLELDCSGPTGFTTGFTVDLALDPSRGPGNLCAAGALAGCPAVLTGASVVDTYLYQVATYRGVEALTSDGVDAQKVYWNVALGVNKGDIGDCWLRTRATADNALGTPVVANGTIASGVVYPYVQWEVKLGTCAAEKLRFGVPDAMVRTAYTDTQGGAMSFDFAYGPGFAAGSVCPAPCVHGTCLAGACVCEAGYTGATCADNPNDCLGITACVGGSCVDGLSAYTCNCAAGSYGTGTTSCSACTAVANCTAVTCSGAGSSTCTACASGYTSPATNCVTNINDCAGVTACVGGSCVDGLNAYTCNCAAGSYGTGTTSCSACTAVANCTAVTCSGAGSSTCTACAAGYTLASGACVASGPPPCGVLGAPCPSGFTCTGAGTCEDADEVWVPAGTFWMGCNAALDSNCAPVSSFASEKPQHLVTLTQAYAVDRTEVTAAAYKAWCGPSTSPLVPGCTPTNTSSDWASYNNASKQDHPVNYVTWTQASAYCVAKGKRLCTEAEWERAARGGCETVTGDCKTRMRKNPWDAGDGSAALSGNCSLANMYAGVSCAPWPAYTVAATSLTAGASPYGALNMVGNVNEWVSDWYAAYDASGLPVTNPVGPGAGTNRIMRGGAFANGAEYTRPSYRESTVPSYANEYHGFRCCRPL